MWDEYKNLILKNCSNYKLFLGLCSEQNNKHIIKDCERTFENYKIDIFENKGVDIGPFLKQLNSLDEKEFPFFIKLHSKKSTIENNINWRVDLVNSLIGTEFTYLKNLELLKKNNVGCIFNRCFLNKNQLNLNSKIKEILSDLNLSYEKLSDSYYMMGSIYFSKTKLFKKYFSSNFISNIYQKLEGYGKIPKEGLYNHSMEIVNGYIIANEKLKILDGVVKSKIVYNADADKNRIHLIELYNGECTTKENIRIRGIIKKDNILWKHANFEQKYQYISNNKLVKKCETFDKVFYKNFNDLKDIKLDDLENHYKNTGKKEGRITKEDITKVFDEKFYKVTYGIKENKYQKILQDYIIKGDSGGRLFNPIIVEDNFDYGFYQSYNKIFEEDKKYNKYTALYDYINTKKKCNNKINYSSDGVEIKALCIYSCNINNKKDIYFLKTNLEILKESFKEIIIIYSSSQQLDFKNSNQINFIKTDLKDCYKKYVSAIKHIKDISIYNSICIIKDNNIVIKNLNKFLEKFLQSDCLLYSTYDCYIKSYHIDDSVLVFRPIDSSKVIESLNLNKNKIELSKFLIKNKYKIGSFFQINQEKELFWRNLFIDMKDYPSVLLASDCPCIDRKNIKYLYQLIPKNFNKTKYKGVLQSFFNIELSKKNINNIFSINFDKIKFCLILHIMDLDKFKDYENFIELLKSKVDVDIYITTNKKSKKGYIKNKGMDIGPFIKTFNKINKKYDYVLKLHSKNLKAFRNLCFNNIIKNIYHHIIILEKNNKIICSGPHIYNLELDNLNETKIEEFINRNNINIKNTTEKNFFAGTMFIAKFKFFKDFFKLINSEEEYKILEEESVINAFPTNTHAWERILTNVIPNYYEMKNSSI